MRFYARLDRGEPVLGETVEEYRALCSAGKVADRLLDDLDGFDDYEDLATEEDDQASRLIMFLVECRKRRHDDLRRERAGLTEAADAVVEVEVDVLLDTHDTPDRPPPRLPDVASLVAAPSAPPVA